MSSAAVWGDRVELTLEVGTGAVGNPLAVWDRDRWDAARWSGTTPSWVDRSCDVVGLSIDRGRDDVLTPFGVSQLQAVVLNDQAQWSWQPHVPADQLPVDVGRPLRVSFLDRVSGVRYPGWQGFLENAEDNYNAAPFVEAQVVAFDALGTLGRVAPAELAAAVGDGDTATVRVGRLLDLARWPAADRDLATTTMLLEGTTYGRSIPQELGDVADSVGGAVFVDRVGRVALRGRDWLRTDPNAATIKAVVGNTGAAGVCPAAIALHGINGDGLVNRSLVSRWDQDPATALVYEDTASSGRYKVRTWERSGLFTKTDADLGLIGRRAVGLGATSRPRITSIDIDPVANPAAWPLVLGVDYAWRLKVDYQHPVQGWTWQLEGLVQSVHHGISPGAWLTTLGVVDAGMFPASAGWDAALWDRDKWAGPPTRDLEEVTA